MWWYLCSFNCTFLCGKMSVTGSKLGQTISFFPSGDFDLQQVLDSTYFFS